MKLIIGISKKLGLPGYSSVGAMCQIESSEFAGGLKADEFRRRVERAFDSCRAAVDAELRRHVPNAGDGASHDEAPLIAARPATANQLQALRTLVARTRLVPEELNRVFVGKPVENLSTSEASAAISQLRRAANGAATVNGFHEGGT